MGAAGVGVEPQRETAVAKVLVGRDKMPVLAGLVLLLATVALYYPVHSHPFINYDDRDYVTENPRVQLGLRPSTVVWAFTTYDAGNWHPVTWLSHALDCQLFGLDPAGHHDVNVLLHALNAVLLFWVLLQATGFAGRSFMVAALFALHPINVESVAWVAERKNVLSMMFFLLALGAYRWYAARPHIGRYGVVAALFSLGLMAKPQIITFPFVLLLWDYWPLRRMFPGGQSEGAAIFETKRVLRLVGEKLPLMVIVAVSAVFTLRAQINARNWFPRPYRLGNAILSYGLYVKKAIWPTKLTLLYPHPGTTLRWGQVALAGVVLIGITALAIVGRRRRYLPVGWFWFLGTLVPMMGVVQVGVQAMADRYAYISFVGLFIMLCWGAAEWAERKSLPAFLLPAVSTVCLLALALVARQQINYWQSNEALWTHALQVTSNNFVAESQLGSALAMSGRVAEGVQHFNNALALNPEDTNSNMGIAVYDIRQKDYRDALQRFEIVVKDKTLRPGFMAEVYRRMAKCYQALGENAKAQESLAQAAQAASQ